MRKQTKVVAVASAAALLAIGASMTSFAATGWVEEGGQWFYYDRDGNRLEDEWRKSGDNWYWLDSEEGGAMATDKLVEDDDDTYYVDANGVMVTNTWVRVVNEDQDDDDDPAEYHYYYMQANGKAYKSSESGNLRRRTIDGKQYAFDEDGIMLYGWVNSNGERLTGDTGWSEVTGADEHVYYFGSWEDGAMKTGWQQITVYDESEGKDDDYDYWFNFKSNGQRRQADDEWRSNSRYYRFDERGVMVYQWAVNNASASNASASNWSYFSSPEDGARMTKGWFKVVAPTEDNTFLENTDTFAEDDSEDESERWYYADGDGELAVGEIKKIKGKYYGFYPEGTHGGRMLTGLCALEVDNDGAIKRVIANNMDGDDLDDCMNNAGDFEGKMTDGASLYYFGNSEDTDGAMKTGNVTISLDGDSYNFSFSKTGGVEGRGKGVNGVEDNKYIYKYGQRIKADSDERYIVVAVDGAAGVDTGATGVTVTEVNSATLRAEAQVAGRNRDGDTVRYVGQVDAKWAPRYYVVNTSGSVQRGKKTAQRDGDDWYFYLNDGQVVLYTNNNNLNGRVVNGVNTMTTDLADWDDWETGSYDPLGAQ